MSVLPALRRWFLTGLIVTAPILLTGYLTWVIVGVIDGYVASFLPDNLNPQNYVSFPLPGFGIIIGAVLIIFIGALATGFLGGALVKIGEKIVDRLPIIRSVYGATKQIMETVMASHSDAFREAVLIEYPRRGIWAIGFVTGKTRGEVQNMSAEDLVNVFVPTTPNPTSGFLLFLPRDEILSLDMGVEEAVKMVVSGGIVTPDDPNAERKPQALGKAAAKQSAKKSAKKAAKKSAAKTVAKKAVKKKTVQKKAAKNA